jgi:diguanylate cyclase (GGDEF)-like protein
MLRQEKWRRAVSLRQKVLAIMAIPILVLVVATAGLLVSRRATTAALAAERHTTALHDAFGQVLIDLNDADTATRGFVITHAASYLDAFDRDLTRLPGDLGAISSLVRGDPSAAAGTSELYRLANERLAILRTTQVEAQVSDQSTLGPMIELMKGGKGVEDQIATVVDEEEANAARELDLSEQRLDQVRHVSFLISIIGLPLGMFAALLVVMLFMERLVTRIRNTEEIARQLDEGMPLRKASTSEDELGRLERVLVLSGKRVADLQDELRRMGTSDPLTRFLNRRGFLPTAEHQLEVAKRAHHRMALAYLDLDGLKHVNDTLGHAAGDGVIAEAAFVMRETFRASDLIARMGGDEFCILFEIDSDVSATAALRRLQDAIDTANAQEGRPFVLSMSAGLATFDPERPSTLDELLAIADSTMYENKRMKHLVSRDVAPVG